MHFDPTLHLGDILALGSLGMVAWQKVAGSLRSIEAFMSESTADRRDLRRRIDELESRFWGYRGLVKED